MIALALTVYSIGAKEGAADLPVTTLTAPPFLLAT